ncbi:hypothetical protein [Orenia marismortui]|uniref:Terminase family protein n=1 Tax=Orenia marismortui TaxID=46469 RepID=A0A4R8H3J2_9FIRM|nr:hypothetical protein [Orenia marismortui]TDX49110.1 hypothetical protein C7959_1204 [Orenia marismortui]
MSKAYTSKQLIKLRQLRWNKYKSVQKDLEFRLAYANEISQQTKQGMLILNEAIRDPSILIELFFMIVNKDRNDVPFFLNEVQKDFKERLMEQIGKYNKGLTNHIKFIVLKGRQQGFTSFITSFQLACTIIKSNFSGYTLAHLGDATKNIFQKKAKYPYDKLPESLQPTEKFNNRRELFFSKINSSWSVHTAGSGEFGRSDTINFFHASEVAFWDSIEDIMAGLGEAIAKGSIEIWETTANGYNEFKTYWDDAKEGNNNYIPVFYEWFRTPEYRLDFETKKDKDRFKQAIEEELSIDGVESKFFTKLKNLRDNHNLDLEQLYWYFNKKKDKKDKLSQEYPCTDKEAFLHSGRPYFNIEIIDNLIIKLKGLRKDYKTEKGGSVVVFEEPQPNIQYVAGCDVAEGVEGGDDSSASFYRMDTWEQVLKINGHFSPDRYGEILVEYGKRYNNTYLGIENNNHGWSTLNTVYHQNNYRNIHFTANFKDKRDKESKKMGWTTNEQSKYLMLDELDSAIRNDEITIYDIHTLEQLREVLYDEKGKVSVNGKDMVVANAIAWQLRKYVKSATATEQVLDLSSW